MINIYTENDDWKTKICFITHFYFLLMFIETPKVHRSRDSSSTEEFEPEPFLFEYGTLNHFTTFHKSF